MESPMADTDSFETLRDRSSGAPSMFELQDLRAPDAPNRMPAEPLALAEPAAVERTDGLPTSEAPAGSLNFVRRKGRWQPESQTRLKNSLLLGVGFLEIANAGDFAANVFNFNPLPKYAVALMALGGILAFSMLYFVVVDSRLSLQNLRGLRAERAFLKAQRERYSSDPSMMRTLDCFLDVNARETGTEIVDRVGMDTLMGFGAFMVGIGTFLAIDGSDSHMYGVSNLLTGYIGNAPCAIYGVSNLLWSTWVWRRANRHKSAALPDIRDRRLKELLKMRASSVQFHGALNGISGIVAGVAALVTATMWWGYVVLAPCLATSVLVNIFWRNRVGYVRPFIRDLVHMDEESLLDALVYVDDCHRRFLGAPDPAEPLAVLVSNPASLSSVMEFILENQLFEEFCLRVLGDPALAAALFNGAGDSLTIRWRQFTALSDEGLISQLLKIANDMVRELAPNCFRHQERYILEALGCYMWISGKKRTEAARGPVERRWSNPNYRNTHSDIGRHTNDWLFGGFSISNLVRDAFRT
jgi:hypothetical protein